MSSNPHKHTHTHTHTGTGYLREEGERRESDFDIGSRDFGENFSPPDAMNSDEENGKGGKTEEGRERGGKREGSGGKREGSEGRMVKEEREDERCAICVVLAK